MMELAEGGSLRDIMETTGVAFQDYEIAYLMHGTLRALQYLHERNIIHRDVKAANLLLNRHGEVKLTDFGISKQIHSTSTIVGTPLWMAPEIAGAKFKAVEYDCRVDIWSLGITAIELVDGVPPHAMLRPALAMIKIASSPPPSVQSPEDVCDELNSFLAACLVKEPSRRPVASRLLDHPFVASPPPPDVMLKSITRFHKAHQQQEVPQKQPSNQGNQLNQSKGESVAPSGSHNQNNLLSFFGICHNIDS